MNRRKIGRRIIAPNVIKVDFSKERLSIDDDPYLNQVTEVHCRRCERRRPRRGAREFEHTWGYLCENCQERVNISRQVFMPDEPPCPPKWYGPVGNSG